MRKIRVNSGLKSVIPDEIIVINPKEKSSVVEAFTSMKCNYGTYFTNIVVDSEKEKVLMHNVEYKDCFSYIAGYMNAISEAKNFLIKDEYNEKNAKNKIIISVENDLKDKSNLVPVIDFENSDIRKFEIIWNNSEILTFIKEAKNVWVAKYQEDCKITSDGMANIYYQLILEEVVYKGLRLNITKNYGKVRFDFFDYKF